MRDDISTKHAVFRPKWLLILLPLLHGAIAHAALDGMVEIETGLIEGKQGDDPTVSAFLGIPYAAPPVGSLRWKPPQPAIPWPEFRRAQHYGATCMQPVGGESPTRPYTAEFNAHGFQSEDCLFLNVWTAATSSNERRPVLVYLYGGGNREGSSDIPIYDGEGLAKKGLVVVTINYRLNIFGFLAHPELSEESGHRVSGNYGLMDQQAALRWVQRNIASFGGDPAKVTVAGQSAGSGDVHYLTISPQARGLFRGAITQSGSRSWHDPALPNSMQTISLADAEELGRQFAKSLGDRSIEEMREMTWHELMESDVRLVTRATIDGWLIPEGFEATFAKGAQNDAVAFTGANWDEHQSSPSPDVDMAAYRQAITERFGDMADEVLALYPVSSDAEAPDAYNEVMRDYSKASMYLFAVDYHQASGKNVYTYRWTHAIPGPEAYRWGAFHCSEIPYFLNTLNRSPRPFEPVDHDIAETMSAYYVNFVTHLDPNGPGLPAWAPVAADSPVTMELGDNFAPMNVAGSEAKLAMYRKFFALQRERGVRW